MTYRPVVSVVIPVLNVAGQLPALMDALERQTWPKDLTEIILVDNGSVDQTVDIAGQYTVKLLRETTQRSPYAARNIGIDASRGEVIALLDANKMPDPLWIQSGVDTLAAQEADLVGGAIHFRLSGFTTAGELADAVLFNNNRELVNRDGGSAGGNLFFRRSVWDKTGSFPSQFRSGMDIWWTRKSVKLGHRLVYAPEAVTWCIPRPAGQVIGKGFRVGKVHPLNMQADGYSIFAIISHSMRTFFPPRPSWVKIRISELVADPPGWMIFRVWGVLWLTRIAMASGRFIGLATLMTSAGHVMKNREQ